MNLYEAIEILEGRRNAWLNLQQNIGVIGGRMKKYGPYGIKIMGLSFNGLKNSVEKMGGQFRLKKIKGRNVGTVKFGGYDFNVVHEPDASPGERELIVFSDGTL